MGKHGPPEDKEKRLQPKRSGRSASRGREKLVLREKNENAVVLGGEHFSAANIHGELTSFETILINWKLRDVSQIFPPAISPGVLYGDYDEPWARVSLLKPDRPLMEPREWSLAPQGWVAHRMLEDYVKERQGKLDQNHEMIMVREVLPSDIKAVLKVLSTIEENKELKENFVKSLANQANQLNPKPSAEVRDAECRQTTLPTSGRRTSDAVRDSDEETSEEEEDEEEARVIPSIELGVAECQQVPHSRRGKKRKSDGLCEDEDEDEEPTRLILKRRRRSRPIKHAQDGDLYIKPEPENEEPTISSSTSSPESEQEPRPRKNKDRRRQSTMTQIASGRKPRRGDKEPDFKPVKYARRGKANNDRAQRTLTQMVPRMLGLGGGIMSDEDMDEELGGGGLGNGDVTDVGDEQEDDEGYNNAIVAHLALNGIFQPAEEDSEDEDADYQPVDDVQAPLKKMRRTHRRVSGKENFGPATSAEAKFTARKAGKTWFSLLSTPQRRRIREIPPSQSPSESPLSTQSSPEKATRSSLKERSANTNQPHDTPSKRKQVKFREPPKDPDPPLPPRRRFGSVIQDSDEEEENWSEEEEDAAESHIIGAETQAMIREMDEGPSVGAETQAMIDRIDQACANADEDAALFDKELFEELGAIGRAAGSQYVMQELGEQYLGINLRDDLEELGEPNHREDTEVEEGDRGHVQIKEEPLDEEDQCGPGHNPPSTQAGNVSNQWHYSQDREQQLEANDDKLPAQLHRPSPIPPNHDAEVEQVPSTPIEIKDESEDDEDITITPPQQPSLQDRPDLYSHPSTPHSPRDLDGEPIQVPRSPSLYPETQNTNHSHSSKAELQLQNEYKSYSQYRRAPPSSSMHVAYDGFSYQATPNLNPAPRQLPPQSPTHLSQATTVDGTQPSPRQTPRKAIPQTVRITTTTPHKVPNLQSFVSPVRPPPLVIPSSPPSPNARRVGDISSPVLGRNGCLEIIGESMGDFSIPPLPPWEDE
ncbi:hypothetical protein K469DRAFT_690979 [Zopfia rhizophila CBS 207.26]|uniref:Uncharacterized protein n=1 Tax=Zopfia rhizophila CBS 207.26 TaxID=1314779 RepID=A0A6A6EQX0_9PEZI|nr:hypothetical protein K469DRAFT_690979 [Zopfia rhizophila CBS 207.26]